MVRGAEERAGKENRTELHNSHTEGKTGQSWSRVGTKNRAELSRVGAESHGRKTGTELEQGLQHSNTSHEPDLVGFWNWGGSGSGQVRSLRRRKENRTYLNRVGTD